jgi:hypothetical protein
MWGGLIVILLGAWMIFAEFYGIDPDNKRPTSQLWITVFGRKWAGLVSIVLGLMLIVLGASIMYVSKA